MYVYHKAVRDVDKLKQHLIETPSGIQHSKALLISGKIISARSIR